VRIELGERLTYWTAPHPRWRPNPEWPEAVGSVLYAAPDSLVLVDPLVRDDLAPDAWDWLDEAVAATAKPVAVLLTAPWHERSTRAVAARYRAAVWAAPRARARIADLPQLGSVPRGIGLFAPRGVDDGQVAFVFEDERTLVVGEFFVGTPSGLRVAPSPETQDLREFLMSLEELQRLPIERVLVSHGPPVESRGKEAISAALASFRSG